MSIKQERIDLSKYRMEKAFERLEASKILLESSLWNDAINRSYYAVFTGARSLLALFGLDSKKHSGVISLFNRCFIQTNILPKNLSKIITSAKEGRESSDYADFIEHTQEEAQTQYEEAKNFLETVQTLTDKIIKNKVTLNLDEIAISKERKGD